MAAISNNSPLIWQILNVSGRQTSGWAASRASATQQIAVLAEISNDEGLQAQLRIWLGFRLEKQGKVEAACSTLNRGLASQISLNERWMG
jgi:hypothetical protein